MAPTPGQENAARFNLPEFNKLYEQSLKLPDSPARTKLFDRMSELMIAYAPWRLTINTIDDAFAYPWVRDYVPHPIRGEGWVYVDVDAARQASKK